MNVADTVSKGRILGAVPATLSQSRMPARHVFAPEQSRPFDPFLYLVHFGPRELLETDWGFGPHPHRGFETVTYLLSGAVEHRDSAGGHAVIGPGDVQWMTAGAGIVHAEEPPAALRRSGGIVHGFQIWLNLPLPLKMAPPGFAVLRGAEMPRAAPTEGVEVRVIGGRCGEVESPLRIHSPLLLWHATLAPRAHWRFAKPAGWTLFTYAFSEAECGRITLFDPEGEQVDIAHDGAAPLELLVMGGAPFGDPIASYGPFVMTSREELIEAVRDYQAGRMGRLDE
ncbi:MAG: pirin family protein [Rhodospirillaceae bacterium]|nr:pirin family protein [Rhodospirillaceae bacterium]